MLASIFQKQLSERKLHVQILARFDERILGHVDGLGVVLGGPWASWGVLGVVLGHLGPHLAPFGASLGSCESIHGRHCGDRP